MPAMKKPKVSIGVLLYRDTKYLNWSLASLLDQDYGNIEFIFRDQSPSGEVYAYLKESHPEFFNKATIIKGENLMHSGGHNAIINKMNGDYYICASSDMLYPKNFVSRTVDEMEKNMAKVAACKLMQWDYEKQLAGDIQGAQTNIIDSFGIGLTRAHKFFDTGQGVNISDFHGRHKIIGPSGALAIFHKDALNAISYKNHDGKLEYFDETMHYKNDCDLAYRLSWSGFSCLVTDTRVYHDRQMGGKNTGALKKLKYHHNKAYWAKESSLFGHLVTLEKNYSKDFSIDIKIRTRLSRVVRFLYTLFFSFGMLSTYSKISVLKKDIARKRKAIKKNVTPEEIQALMT